MDVVRSVIIIVVILLVGGVSVSVAQDHQADLATSANPDHQGKVTRAQFTSEVVAREPVDSVLTLKNDVDKIYFFSELVNLKGRRITHRWEYQGKVMAEIEFNVTSNRWRAYSSKTLTPQWLGEWSVVVVDDAGWPLKASLFEYGEKTILE